MPLFIFKHHVHNLRIILSLLPSTFLQPGVNYGERFSLARLMVIPLSNYLEQRNKHHIYSLISFPSIHFLFSSLPISERKAEGFNLIYGGRSNPKYTFFQLGDGARRQGQPAGFHLAAIILCLVYTIKLQCLAFILTVIVCLIADSSMSHPDRVSDFGKASSLTLVVAIWAVNASSIFSLAPASLGFATTAFLVFLQISVESMAWRLSRGPMAMYIQPGPSYNLVVLWMTSHISADTSVCWRWQGGRGSRETTREKSRMQKQPWPGKPERYHWRVRWGDKESNLPDLSSFWESHLLHSSGIVLRDVTEYWMGRQRERGVR